MYTTAFENKETLVSAIFKQPMLSFYSSSSLMNTIRIQWDIYSLHLINETFQFQLINLLYVTFSYFCK